VDIARRALVAALITLSAPGAIGARARSNAARHHFQHQHPCPATGRTSGACPGYVIDHVVPLCAGGADAPSNMQWQTTEAAAIKDRFEWEDCRQRRRPPDATAR
jgi:hypothetical protein